MHYGETSAAKHAIIHQVLASIFSCGLLICTRRKSWQIFDVDQSVQWTPNSMKYQKNCIHTKHIGLQIHHTFWLKQVFCLKMLNTSAMFWRTDETVWKLHTRVKVGDWCSKVQTSMCGQIVVCNYPNVCMAWFQSMCELLTVQEAGLTTTLV